MPARSKRLALLGALSMMASVFALPAGPARAANALTVDVAQPFFDDVPAEGMRFYAPALNVEKGTSVGFNIQGFHTATLLPADTDVHGWVATNAGGIGKPYSLLAPDADDNTEAGGTTGQPSLKANNAALLSSDPTCGTPDNPCDYDGSAVVNSGAPFGPGEPFSVTIDAQPGDVVWVVCLIHPHMRLKITVVATAAEATTQAAVDAFATSAKAQDLDWAQSTHTRLLTKQSSHVTADGKRVKDVYVGYDNHWTSLFGMYPRRVDLRKGQTARFHFDGLVYEDHTATFPLSKGKTVAGESFVPACDPDGDDGAGPDNPPDLEAPPFCSDPSQLEFDIQPEFAYTQGDGVFTGNSDFESSGVRGANATSASWDLKFTKTSGDTPFKYLCAIHPFMRG